MHYRNYFFSALLFLVISGFTNNDRAKINPIVKRWLVSQNSSLNVNGSTNVNRFTCVIPACPGKDTLTVNLDKSDQPVGLTGRIGLPVSSFDCHLSAMTRQLRETLKEKQFPALYIRFLTLSRLPQITDVPTQVNGLVEIEIAGVTRRFEISYQLNRDRQQVIHLKGTHMVNFSDFNLKPPTKLGGMIKTKDALNVDFQLNITELL
ncbi:YceI family protein [Mucilaginibacter ximonensis]|uniref:YceI family protein n=1 Tax=Mucilaginibacter ximonensis TaxID=538021 RepID=A0ABW5YEM4_9SPHI